MSTSRHCVGYKLGYWDRDDTFQGNLNRISREMRDYPSVGHIEAELDCELYRTLPWIDARQPLTKARGDEEQAATQVAEPSGPSASQADQDRLDFYNQQKAVNAKLTHAQIASLWQQTTKEPCDKTAMKQSVYRARRAVKGA